MVYYLNSQNELRAFLDDPRLVPDTNRSDRAVRTLTVLRAASGFKQSPEFADSMCGWFTLMETAKANGIDNPVLWFKQYSRALAQHVELGRGRGISNLDKKARITRTAPLI